MTIKKEISFSDFEPWSGAVENFNRIIDEGKADEAEAYFQDLEPAEGWTETAINDWLWFNATDVFTALGIKPKGTETKTAEEIGEAWLDAQPLAFDVVGVKVVSDFVSVEYKDPKKPEDGEMSQELTAEEVAHLFGKDCGEINTDDWTVDIWGE